MAAAAAAAAFFCWRTRLFFARACVPPACPPPHTHATRTHNKLAHLELRVGAGLADEDVVWVAELKVLVEAADRAQIIKDNPQPALGDRHAARLKLGLALSLLLLCWWFGWRFGRGVGGEWVEQRASRR